MINPIGLISSVAWRAACAFLAACLLAVSTALYFANSSRDDLRKDLIVEQAKASELRASVGMQNTAIEAMRKESEARDGMIAASVALAKDRTAMAAQALDGMKAAQAKTCTDAMAYVNAALKGLGQ